MTTPKTPPGLHPWLPKKSRDFRLAGSGACRAGTLLAMRFSARAEIGDVLMGVCGTVTSLQSLSRRNVTGVALGETESTKHI